MAITRTTPGGIQAFRRISEDAPTPPVQSNETGSLDPASDEFKKKLDALEVEFAAYKAKANLTKADSVEEAKYPDKVHIHPTGEGYQNISLTDAAKMTGYFTSKLLTAGTPWELKRDSDWFWGKPKTSISEMEALSRLEKGEEVIFQPKRVVSLNFSPDQLVAVATVASPLNPAKPLAEAGEKSKISADPEGVELDFGASIPIHNFRELKLLFEIYNPEARPGDKDELGTLTNKLSYFTQKARGTAYPKQALFLGAVGAVVGAILGGPLTGSLLAAVGGSLRAAQIGAGVGAAFGAIRGASSTLRKGKEINGFETLKRLLDEDPVMFQRMKIHGITLPFIGKWTWFTDHGRGSVIGSKEQFETYYQMQSA
ncbi:MAG: hypothetical protein HYU64_13340 [Armatimonadetes bacterium]|nr:hypothetical protein [Armatimonadota bacterium]